jgi:hypothetical protein
VTTRRGRFKQSCLLKIHFHARTISQRQLSTVKRGTR